MRKLSILGININVDDSENTIFWDYVAAEKWEKETFQVLKKYLKEGDVFIDIGTWVGVFSFYAAQIGATCHAIDADKWALAAFEKNLRLNPFLADKIQVHHFALNATNSPVSLYARETFGASSSSILHRLRDNLKQDAIQGQTFADFYQQQALQHIHLIKMDIEGAEFMLLAKMAEDLPRYDFPTLYVEFHPSYLIEAEMQRLMPLVFLGKICLKLCKIFDIPLFRQKIAAQYRPILATFAPHYEISCQGKVLDWQQWLASPAFMQPCTLLFAKK